MEQFLPVIKKCRDGEQSPKDALKELEQLYKSAISKNKQKITGILNEHRYYDDIKYTKDELINVYDKSINSTSEFERNEYEKRLKSKIGDIIVEKTSMIQPHEYENVTEHDYEQLKDIIYHERNEVAELCQENRRIKEYYEKIITEVVNISSNDKMPPPKKPILINEIFESLIKECSYLEIQENGRYRITCSMNDFISWLLSHGFIDKDRKPGMDEVSAEFILSRFDSRCKKLETIEKAIRSVCGVKKSKSG
jgi:hypothetical protein